MNNKSEEDTGLDPIVVVVPSGHAGVRLDKFLADAYPDLSRTRFQSLIESGAVIRDDVPILEAAYKIKIGEVYQFIIPQAVEANPVPENIPIDIIFEDDDLLVINKHQEMVVHPAPGHYTGTLVNALLYHCGDTLSGVGGVKRPGIVHRLDRGTSGLMMVAKNDYTHAALQAQLQDRTLGRIYEAVTFKVPMPPVGTINKSIGRHPVQRLKMHVGGKDARDAITHYRVLGALAHGAAGRVECRLATGRTHQIRVHLASLGHPLVGDPLYGVQTTAWQAALKMAGLSGEEVGAVLGFNRQALHAREIHFVHPRTAKNESFQVGPPDDFLNLINLLNRTGRG